MRSRPDQDRTDVAAEHGGGGEREGRLIEDIGFKRARGKIAPLLDEGHEIGEPAPFDGKRTGGVAVGEYGAPGAGNGGNGALKRDARRDVRTDRCHEDLNSEAAALARRR